MGLGVLVPAAVHDVRGEAVTELRYPADAVVILAGVPGAGKTTALRRLFAVPVGALAPARAADGAWVVDSEQPRHWLQRWLIRVPYLLWRPVVHAVHYWWIRRAIRESSDPVLIHDCGTRRWTRWLIGLWARSRGRTLHLILLDVPPVTALAGQRERGRHVNPLMFALHCRRWLHLLAALQAGTVTPRPASAVIVDRPGIDGMRRVTFG